MTKLLILLALLSLLSCKEEEAPFRPRHNNPPKRYDHSGIGKKSDCEKKPVVIAVLDTGFGFNGLGEDVKLCKTGHKDFTTVKSYTSKFNTTDPIPVDKVEHGTHVAGLINKYAKQKHEDYCLVILKFWDKNTDTELTTIKAIQYATQIGADYINYSGGGTELIQEEVDAVKAFLDKGGKFIAAAGNGGTNLSKVPYYPAMDDSRVIVVGNVNSFGSRVESSNYGDRVNVWEVGYRIEIYGITMTGTSQAAAITTGKMVGNTKVECSK